MFKEFLIESTKEEIEKSIKKLPKKYQKLARNYSIEIQPTETLKGTKEYVGSVSADDKKIQLASPYFYPREFVLFHEIGHLAYSLLGKELKKEWEELVKTKGDKQETFCHFFANYYSENKLKKFCDKKIDEFMKKIERDEKVKALIYLTQK